MDGWLSVCRSWRRLAKYVADIVIDVSKMEHAA
jgi:hypothetical protein